MKKIKILYLIQKGTNDYYQEQRKKYEIDAEWVFKNDYLLIRILRKLFKKIYPRLLAFLYGDWKNKIGSYDLIIVHESLYSAYAAYYITKRTKKRVILWYWNSIGHGTFIHPELINCCELWSYDQYDCKKYNMQYNTTYYFSKISIPKVNILYDIFFIGMDKGRINKLLELEKVFQKQGLLSYFHITRPEKENANKYKFKDSISYEKVLEIIASSRCILDIVQENQHGLTQRPMESIFLRKKLITNDINIQNYDFYNRNNIFIIEKDDFSSLKEFIYSEYVELDEKILKKYDFDEWLRRIESMDD